MSSPLDFDLSEIRRFSDPTQGVIRLALDLGWRLRWQNGQHYVLVASSPVDSKFINIPTTNVNNNRNLSWVKSIRRHSDQERVAALDAQHQAEKLPKPSMVIPSAEGATFDPEHLPEHIKRLLPAESNAPTPTEEPVVNDSVTEAEPTWERAAIFDNYGSEWWMAKIDDEVYFECRAATHEQPYRTNSSPSRGSHTTSHSHKFQEGRVQAGRTNSGRKVISRSPWIMSSGQPSAYTTEVRRENGTVEYVCSTCHNFTRSNPASVSQHNRMAHGVREAHPAPTLASPRVQAAYAAVASADNSDLADKIRALLGGDDRVAQLETLLGYAEEELKQWQARAVKAEGDLQALRDLIQGLGS